MIGPPGRRRFLAIAGFLTVGAAFGPARATSAPLRWRGIALGAEASIEVHGPGGQLGPALEAAVAELRRVEALFSLHDPRSSLARLNAAGLLTEPAPRFHQLFDVVDRLHAATGGRFDPTIQPLWRALAEGGDAAAARALVGWERVTRAGRSVRLASGQALTLNGIAQGYATDLVAERLRAAGAIKTLVNIGEFAGLGGPWRIGVADPAHGLVAVQSLSDGAMATSSPGALMLDDRASHILDPRGDGVALWSTVTVEAATATLADGLSTAFCFADRPQIRNIAARVGGVRRIILVDAGGDLTTLRG